MISCIHWAELARMNPTENYTVNTWLKNFFMCSTFYIFFLVKILVPLRVGLLFISPRSVIGCKKRGWHL